MSGILRLRARPTKELEERLLKVEVESGEALTWKQPPRRHS